MNIVYRTSDGIPVSVGTVVADPLPDGLAVLTITDETWAEWRYVEAFIVEDGRLVEVEPVVADDVL